MLLNFLTLGYVQSQVDKEQTFYTDIYSLPPAHYLVFTLKDLTSKIVRYWNINKELKIGIAPVDAIEKLEAMLAISVKRRLRSDVAVGTSLSGGLDSSSILYEMMSFAPTSKIETFSATFPGFAKDESSYIDLITKQFNIENFSVQPSGHDLISSFEKICYHQEEPFDSSSIYAQYKVFELAKQHDIKVLLDGQGADESLAGYTKYMHWFLQEVLSRHKLGYTRKERLALIKNEQRFRWGIKNYFAAFFPAHASIQLEKREYFKTLDNPDISKDLLHILKGHEWEGIHKPIITKLNDVLHFNVMEAGLEELLRFADRNSMAHGREVRLPFLNHELVEFIFSLPSNLKIHDGWTKWVLRKAMDKKLPDAITWRKDKVGYEPPQKQWMEDKEMQAFTYFAKEKLVAANILSPKVLSKKMVPKDAHAADNFDWRYLCAAQFL
jgi:asparagine synthase (glutamine-hydrolysing)